MTCFSSSLLHMQDLHPTPNHALFAGAVLLLRAVYPGWFQSLLGSTSQPKHTLTCKTWKLQKAYNLEVPKKFVNMFSVRDFIEAHRALLHLCNIQREGVTTWLNDWDYDYIQHIQHLRYRNVAVMPLELSRLTESPEWHELATITIVHLVGQR